MLVVLIAACGGAKAPVGTVTPVPARAATVTDRILPLLPDGAQVIVEVDLARLRANAVVGEVAGTALDRLGADTHVPGLPVTMQGSPLATADAIVLAAYGLGSATPATLVVLATHHDVPGGTRLSPELVALGSDDWVGQLQARAALDGLSPDGAPLPHTATLTAPTAMLALREHAMPAGAEGAVLRVTARLSFDARVALARQLGVELAPAQLSIWGDLADDLAIVIDADAVDPGDKAAKDSARRLATAMRGALGAAADEPMIRALGVPVSLTDARLVTKGTWVRAIIAIGPRHLARVVERARAMLSPS